MTFALALVIATALATPVSPQVAGSAAALKYPSSAPIEPSAELLAWRGWGYLPAEGREFPKLYPAAGDWGPVASAPEPGKDALVWREKIVIVRRLDLMDRLPNGLFIQRRSSLSSVDIRQLREAIARWARLVAIETGGRMRVEADVEVDDAPLLTDSKYDLGAFEEDELRSRVNAGGYEPDDRVFRGPYHGVMVVHPGFGGVLASKRPFGEVESVSVADAPPNATPGALEIDMLTAWQRQLRALAEWRVHILVGDGVDSTPPSPLTGASSATRVVPEPLWPGLMAWDRSIEFIARRAHERLGSPWSLGSDRQAAGWFSLLSNAFRSSNVALDLVSDVDRGKVLRSSERGSFRAGGTALPVAKDTRVVFDATASSRLTFWARSTSRDPIGVWLRGKDKALVLCLGSDALAPESGPRSETTRVLAFQRNGAWQQVVANVSGLGRVTSIEIGPTPRALESERTELSPIEADFDDFRVSNDASGLTPIIQGGPSPNEPAGRALSAWKLAADGTPEARASLIKLLTDPSDLVRLNALKAIAPLKAQEAFASLAQEARDLDPRTAEAALEGLQALGTSEAWSEIRRVLEAGTSEEARAVAARLLSAQGDSKLAGPISGLLSSRNWRTRRAAARAIAALPGKDPAIIELIFLQETDPAVRLAATQGADASYELVANRLLWTAVNDPSDAVRAAAYAKLIGSDKENFRREGYRGIRDDGRGVRLELLKLFADKPSEAHRGALRIAVADPDPEVRAAALRAFTVLQGVVSLEEIGNVLKDRHPWVQAALLDLSRARSLPLPDETLALLRDSLDPDVARRAKGGE
ncbi:MAG: HEAT repeat domain-containing protein [Fimbriimonas ginsengisoli]|uniref:HEAT repeat domain-containing protein n=1 Tax=Fimbriimonas ginsengisoli TaxID=1005039 RepID=A0A931LWP5_FIMGI|nr:HEAT repeat domain-containing protein [Fimbriimonas ginsengisoli]MBI3721331.1 HEAT repeat domain-containing protein [Fimbriimonas ginsengisoli]